MIASSLSSQSGGNPGDLSSMLGQLDLGSEEEGEDGLMKMMQGMMTTLLSREVLYPSLTDLCKQVQWSTVSYYCMDAVLNLWCTNEI